MRDFIILAIILGSVPICFFSPYVGVLMWSWISYFNPHRFAWGLAYNFPVALVIAVPTLLGTLIFGKINRQFLTRETLLLLLMWVWFGFTLFYASQVPAFADHLAQGQDRFVVVSKMLVMTILTILLVNSEKKLRYLFLLTAFSFGALALKGMIFGLRTQGEFRMWGPPDSFVGDNNAFALAVNMALPMLFFLAREEQNRLLHFILRVAFVCCVISVILTFSRGGLLGMAVVLSAIAFKARRKLISGVLLLVCGVMILSFAPSHWTARMGAFLGGQLDRSAEQRLNAWHFSWNLAKEYPLTGGGFETFTPELFLRYAPDPSVMWQGPHSIYFQVLGEHGFVGLGLYLFLLGSTWVELRRLRKRARHVPSMRWVVSYSHMLEVSLWAFMVSGAFLGLGYFDLYFQLIATTVILKILYQREVVLSVRAREEHSSLTGVREQMAS